MAGDVYFALIGDLVASRRTETDRRHGIQVAWAERFDALPDGGGPGGASRPTITLGDEFQALFTADGTGVRRLMGLMEEAIIDARPVRVRFGIGLGALTTPLRSVTLGMDGPAFHRAREALTVAHDDGWACRLEAGAEARDRVWSALASYCLEARFDWSDLQWEAIEAYQRLGSWSDVAAELGVSRGAVSQRQKAAGWGLYRKAWDGLTEELGERWNEEDSV